MWKKLSLASKELINSYQVESSSIENDSFRNLEAYNTTFTFMFLNDKITCEIYYIEYRGWLFLKYYCYDNKQFYYLTPRGNGNLSDLVIFLQTDAIDRDVIIKCADAIWRKRLEIYTSKCLETPEEFDYVYLKQQLIELSHHKLRYKQKLLDDFQRDTSMYTVLTRVINAYDRDILLDFFDKWAQTKKMESSIEIEKQMIMKLFNNYESLNVHGILIYIVHDENKLQIIGFSIAEILDENMLLIHFEKADSSIKGSSVYLITQFLKQDKFANIIYVNKQDDMGNPTLRQSKKSYLPTFLIEKYDIILGDS